MRESELLELIEQRSRDISGRGAVVVGPGDDAAVLDLPGLTLVTVDHLVEGRHYDASATIDQIARKAVARSVSDIAAMGGTPSCALGTGCLHSDFRFADELFERMAFWAHHFGCPLAGGDIATSDHPNVLTVTVIGRAHAVRGPVLRSTAQAGDVVCVTGAVGGSLMSGRHLSFEPRIGAACALCDRLGPALTAMIDLSDGLGRDADRVARASRVRMALDSSRLPLNSEAGHWRSAAADGEDYELLFCVSGERAVPAEVLGVPVTVIGRCAAGGPPGAVFVDENGEETLARELGWDHGA